MKVDDLIKALYAGEVTVEYRKLGTNELRVMPCTLSTDIIPHRMKINPSSHTIIMWALDKQAWRDVLVSTIEKWYVNEKAQKEYLHRFSTYYLVGCLPDSSR